MIFADFSVQKRLLTWTTLAAVYRIRIVSGRFVKSGPRSGQVRSDPVPDPAAKICGQNITKEKIEYLKK